MFSSPTRAGALTYVTCVAGVPWRGSPYQSCVPGCAACAAAAEHCAPHATLPRRCRDVAANAGESSCTNQLLGGVNYSPSVTATSPPNCGAPYVTWSAKQGLFYHVVLAEKGAAGKPFQLNVY